MIVARVDRRDILWEAERPTYRVYFWRQPQAPVGTPQERMMYVSEEWRLQEAESVEAVLDWATSHATGRTFAVYVGHRAR